MVTYIKSTKIIFNPQTNRYELADKNIENDVQQKEESIPSQIEETTLDTNAQIENKNMPANEKPAKVIKQDTELRVNALAETESLPVEVAKPSTDSNESNQLVSNVTVPKAAEEKLKKSKRRLKLINISLVGLVAAALIFVPNSPKILDWAQEQIHEFSIEQELNDKVNQEELEGLKNGIVTINPFKEAITGNTKMIIEKTDGLFTQNLQVVQENKGEIDYYLKHDAKGNYDEAGTPFIDYRSNADSECIMIKGHHMSAGTKFGTIANYGSSVQKNGQMEGQRLYDKISTFNMFSSDRMYEAKVASVFDGIMENNNPDNIYQWGGDFKDEKDYNNKIEYLLKQNMLDTNAEIPSYKEIKSKNAKIALLITCPEFVGQNQDTRRVIACVLKTKVKFFDAAKYSEQNDNQKQQVRSSR